MSPPGATRVVVAAARSLVALQNEFNFSAMHNYDQIVSQEQLATHVQVLHALVTSMLNEINKAKHNKEINDVDPCTESHEVVQSKVALAVNRILVCFLSFVEPNYSWEYATLVALEARCLAHTMEIVDLLVIVVPGMCTGVTLNMRIDNFVKLSRENVQPLDQSFIAWIRHLSRRWWLCSKKRFVQTSIQHFTILTESFRRSLWWYIGCSG